MIRTSASSRRAASADPRGETDVQVGFESKDDTWYRNRILWLVIAIPALTVAGCLLTIYLALSRPHQLVTDPATAAGGAIATDD